jgi:CRP-like cAMP-binding protein
MDARELKERASQLFSRGKFGKAAEAYEASCKADPRDLQSRMRLGDCWVKDGQRERAIAAYLSAAEAFAREGFLPRAIAAGKLVLELDAAHTGVQTMLASLYARKSSTPSRVSRGPAPALSPPPTSSPSGAEPPPPPPPADTEAFAGLTPPPPPPAAGEEAIEIEVEAGVEGQAEEVEIEVEVESRPEVGPTDDGGITLELEAEAEAVAEVAAPAGEAAPEARADPGEGSHPGPSSREAPAERVALSGGPARGRPPGDAGPELFQDLSGLEDPFTLPAPPPAASPGFDLTLADLEDAPPPRPPPPAAPPLVTASAGSLTDPPASTFPSGRPSDLDRSLQALMEEATLLDLPPPSATFTELELDDAESLLHSVAAASAVAPSREEAMEAPEELPPGALPRIPLFSDLPEEAFIALFTRCPLRRLAPGEVVLSQGTKGDAFYVVCAGQVKVSRLDGGQRRELATLDEGAFFGEMALLSAAPRSATVVASAEDTQLLEISGAVLTDLSRQHPSVSRALRQFCRQRLLANLMATARLFQPFSRSDRRDLVARFLARDVPAGEVVLEEGRPSDGLYVVLSGEVQVTIKGARVALLREGELFGERSLLTRSPAGATVRAARHTSLLRLPRADFNALILSHPQVLELVSELTDAREQVNDRRGQV